MDLDNESEINVLNQENRLGLYCMCIVVGREKLLTNAGMFVYITRVLNFRCDSKMVVSSAYYSRPAS